MRHDQDAAVAGATVAEPNATRQYSGALGGIALCEVAVTLTYASSRGHALIVRALYLPEGCAADEEHRDLAGVPEEVLFATKPQLAGALLDRAQSLGIRAAFVVGDEVYGHRELRQSIRQRGMGYGMAVPASHVVTVGSGRTVTAAEAAGVILARAWRRMRTGSGTKGTRHYDWAILEVTSDDTPGGHDGRHSVLLALRHRYTGQLSFYRCWTPGPVPLSRLIAIAVARWRIEMARPGPPAALVSVATPPPAPRPPSPPALERLRRDNAMITTNYSCRNCWLNSARRDDIESE